MEKVNDHQHSNTIKEEEMEENISEVAFLKLAREVRETKRKQMALQEKIDDLNYDLKHMETDIGFYEECYNDNKWYDKESLREPQEEFWVPDWYEVVSQYPEITGIHPALMAYPHTNFQYYYEELCFSWRGISQPVLLDKDGLLLDGRMRLLVENRFPGESLGSVPFQYRKGDPWEIVFLANQKRIALQNSYDIDELSKIHQNIQAFHRTPYYREEE